MTLTITLSPNAERALRERAARDGRDMTDVARDLVERGVLAPTLDEILGPFRQEVAASGVSDAELDALFDEGRNEAWEQRQRR
jgi:plasmid stability protein